jgi:hypothetical protein
MRAALLTLTLLPACAASLSSFQPAHVPPPGHVQFETGVDASIPTGTISKTVDAAKTLVKAAATRSLNTEERRQLFEAGANLALDPPSAIYHLGVAYVPFDSLELNLRYSSGGWRGGVRRQFLTQEQSGVDFTAGAAFGYHSVEFPIDKVLDILTLEDFKRYSLEVPVVLGVHSPWYRVWGGPRFILAHYSTAMNLNLPATGSTPAEIVAASVEGTATFIGAQFGAALGYAHLFVAVELTIARLISTAALSAPGLDQELDVGGTIVYPGIAVMGEF